ncbi:MAG: prohibitin family protein [Salinivirgaceae bacterium]|nr:prohibitin family protein [Salinivirgaceae bacterium]MDD4747431.1 prohibitin family protein [Salinivirgaceae bacterium]MDY0280393.1 prohibitin family protein [Salinivirgaceae bacterium]
MNMKKMQPLLLIGAAGIILIVLFSNSMFFKINPGDRAIIFRQFSTGLDTGNIFQPGFHVVAPWNDFIVYNVKEQTKEETMDVLDKSGLSLNVEISVRFNPLFSRLALLHQQFGVDYVNLLVIPEVRSVVRQVAGRYTAEEIYSTKRGEVEMSIVREAEMKLKSNFVDMRALLIRSIKLPNDIRGAIESKLTQEQEALAYKFKLERETSEALRKKIQAEGEAVANKIINSSLTSSLLKMRGIEATLKLSESPNSKTIIIGGSDGGLPLILNAEK